jgi:hypothetical protein
MLGRPVGLLFDMLNYTYNLLGLGTWIRIVRMGGIRLILLIIQVEGNMWLRYCYFMLIYVIFKLRFFFHIPSLICQSQTFKAETLAHK